MRLFPYNRWAPDLPEMGKGYGSAKPFPHVHLNNFLDETIACKLLQEFPQPEDTSWIHYKHVNENKLGKNKREHFPETIGHVVDELNSQDFVSFLSELTGIKGLVADPTLEGGGMHQTESGGFLNVHADFTMHHRKSGWRRRVNLILYLNPGWKTEWGGELELWDKDVSRCAVRLPPIFNSAVIFNTDETSFHGYPDAIKFPEGTTRKSLALYYYTTGEDSNCKARSTNYRSRPNDNLKSSLLIWADKKAVQFYSVLKRKLNLSDETASKWLSHLSAKRK